MNNLIQITAPKDTALGTYQRVLEALQRLEPSEKKLVAGQLWYCVTNYVCGVEKKEACYCSMGAAYIGQAYPSGISDLCNVDNTKWDGPRGVGFGWDNKAVGAIIDHNDNFADGRNTNEINKERYFEMVSWLKTRIAASNPSVSGGC